MVSSALPSSNAALCPRVGSAAGQGLLSVPQKSLCTGGTTARAARSSPARNVAFSFAPYRDKAPTVELGARLHPHPRILALRITAE